AVAGVHFPRGNRGCAHLRISSLWLMVRMGWLRAASPAVRASGFILSRALTLVKQLMFLKSACGIMHSAAASGRVGFLETQGGYGRGVRSDVPSLPGGCPPVGQKVDRHAAAGAH